MGYPSDLSGGERPSFQGNAVISSAEIQNAAGEDGDELGEFNDVVEGQSGGPVWGWWEDEPWPRVVGVHSASPFVCPTDRSRDNKDGGGSALSDLITWARSNYP